MTDSRDVVRTGLQRATTESTAPEKPTNGFGEYLEANGGSELHRRLGRPRLGIRRRPTSEDIEDVRPLAAASLSVK